MPRPNRRPGVQPWSCDYSPASPTPRRSAGSGLAWRTPSVSPSTEVIVRRCLERDPTPRYPSARALAEDLDRQLAHQPLAHTREPSVRERLLKWRRRHPRLTSTGTVAALAGVLVLLL